MVTSLILPEDITLDICVKLVTTVTVCMLYAREVREKIDILENDFSSTP